MILLFLILTIEGGLDSNRKDFLYETRFEALGEYKDRYVTEFLSESWEIMTVSILDDIEMEIVSVFLSVIRRCS